MLHRDTAAVQCDGSESVTAPGPLPCYCPSQPYAHPVLCNSRWSVVLALLLRPGLSSISITSSVLTVNHRRAVL